MDRSYQKTFQLVFNFNENGSGNSNNNGNGGNDNSNSNGNSSGNSSNGNGKEKNNNGNAYGKNKEKSNNGKHLGWYKNPKNPNYIEGEYDLTNPEIFEVTNLINDISGEYTQVLMTTDAFEGKSDWSPNLLNIALDLFGRGFGELLFAYSKAAYALVQRHVPVDVFDLGINDPEDFTLGYILLSKFFTDDIHGWNDHCVDKGFF